MVVHVLNIATCLELMKEKQPMNFGQARSFQLVISRCLDAFHMHLCQKS